MTYIVKVIEDATGEVVKVMFADSERQAVKLHNGLFINMNHNEFTVKIEEIK